MATLKFRSNGMLPYRWVLSFKPELKSYNKYETRASEDSAFPAVRASHTEAEKGHFKSDSRCH